MTQPVHVLINGLSLIAGGAFVVSREQWKCMGSMKPNWTFTLVVVDGAHLRASLEGESYPENCRIFWAPARALNRAYRMYYERTELSRLADKLNVDVVLQQNGMIVPAIRQPTMSHYHDPWPYQPIAWASHYDRFLAFLKRRANRRALIHARHVSFTSRYLQELICGFHNLSPPNNRVVHNGIPDEWIERAKDNLPDWNSRPLEIGTISTVVPYKRQSLVIEALPRLLKQKGLENLVYRIVGIFRPESYQLELEALAERLGVRDHVIFEGHVSYDRLCEVFAGIRAYILMSTCESFGIPAIEAMSFGTPVVTSDCCAMPEVCGDAAEFVEVDNVEQLAERIAKVLLDPGHAQAMRLKGVENVKRFGWRASAEGMVECIEKILDDSPPRSS